MNDQTTKPAPGGRLPGLEALRFVAAFCVLLLHTRAVYGGTPVFARGYLGVDFFLMLTGFLMARVQEARLDGGLAPLGFLGNRYRRLWPMMAAGALLGMPMQWLRAHGAIGDFAEVITLNLLLLPVFDHPFVFPVNIPAWTIFYDLFAVACHVLGLRHLRRWWLPLAIALLAPAEVWIALHWHGVDVGAKPATFVAGAVRIVFAYMIGMALARWWRDGPALPVPAIPAILAMPVVLVAGWYFDLGGAWFDLGFVVLVAPLMIAGGLRLRRFGAQAGWLGQLSFPLFALQMPVLEGLRHLGAGKWIGGPAAFAVGVAGLLISNALGTWHRKRAM
ncbi:MAG: acyltransferase [Sphingomonadales bacterium]|nr:acyltransferase [Sphingomonadales bacterium]